MYHLKNLITIETNLFIHFFLKFIFPFFTLSFNNLQVFLNINQYFTNINFQYNSYQILSFHIFRIDYLKKIQDL